MKSNICISLLMVLFSVASYTQHTEQQQKATLVKLAESMIEMPSIASQIASGKFIPAKDIHKEVNPKKTAGNKAVPGKGLPKGKDPLWNKKSPVNKIKGKEPILVFEAASTYSTPTDPTGAVGPNHFVNAWNSSFRIWDKEGNPLTEPASLGTILPGTQGDPIVIYDPYADRFLLTEFYSNGFYVGITKGPDPVNDGWYVYSFPTSSFPDYPKFSVWSDGYYITANKDSFSAATSEVVFVIERDKLIAGDEDAAMIGFPLTNIITSGFFSPLGFNVNGDTLPPAGNAPIVYMQDDAWSGVTQDHLKIWNINVDWNNPDNSTISNPQIIYTEPFDGVFDGGSFSNLPQPDGEDIDALQATIMYMAQYRRFPTHNSVVFNFVVDLDGNDNYAGIRWYELRQSFDGESWNIFQESTYVQPDGHSACMGTMCMDIDGNIALAYSIVSNNEYPSLRYTGRFATDVPGIMTFEEKTIASSTQSNPSYRYGDYSQMTIDPLDDKTFWFIGEYFSEEARKNQVGVFKIASGHANDVGIVGIDSPVNGVLTGEEQITVTIRNFGNNDQKEIPLSFQINEGAVINETFNGTIKSKDVAQYSFVATGDFSTAGETYEILASTILITDEDTINDAMITSVTSIYPDDIGVTQILTPVSGAELTETEYISVTIENFGGAAQSNFDISYTLNDENPIIEQVGKTIKTDSSLTYIFETPGNLSPLGDHQLSATTLLPGDTDNSNDATDTIISKELCQPFLDCTSGDGIAILELRNIYNASGCDPYGYGDYTDLSTDLKRGSSNDLIITTLQGNQYVKVWIDFNDNFVFDTSEIIVDEHVIAQGEGQGEFTDTIHLVIPDEVNLGEHLMRIKTNRNMPVSDNPCEVTKFGETEDYVVNIIIPNQTQDFFETNELIVSSSGNNQFKVVLTSNESMETLIVTVHNISGQTVIYNRVSNHNGEYIYDFDMSHAKPGVYLLRLGSSLYGKVKKIVVN